MTLNPSKGRELLGAVAAATTYNDTGVAAVALLNFLLRQLEELRGLANGYPRNPISGDVWFEGKALAELCDELTELLSAWPLPEQKELASRLATGMACQVMAHYPQEIFPRVVRNARCREEINQVDHAIGNYEAVISDFRELDLSYLLDHNETLDDAGRTILAAVLQAATRLIDLRPERAAELQPFRVILAQRLSTSTARSEALTTI